MAKSNLGTLTVDLVARTANWVDGLNRSEREMNRFRRQIDRQLNQLKKQVESGLKVSAGIVSGLAASMAVLTKQGIDAAQSQAKLSRALGTTYDELTALKMAAGYNSLEGLENSMSRLNRRLGEAQQGAGVAVKTLNALGLEAKALSEMSATERMATLADRIKEVSRNSSEAAAHAKNLGFMQAEAVDLFMQGGEAFRAYNREVKELGLSIADIDASVIEAASNSFTTIQTVLGGVGQQLAVQISPVLIAAEQTLKGWVKELGGAEVIAKTLSWTMLDIANAVDNTYQVTAKGLTTIFEAMKVAYTWVESKSTNIVGKTKGRLAELGAKLGKWVWGGDTDVTFTVNESAVNDAVAALDAAIARFDKNLFEDPDIDRVRRGYATIAADARKAAEEAAAALSKGMASIDTGPSVATIEKLGKTYADLLGQFDERQAALNRFNATILEINESQATQAEKAELAALAQTAYGEALESINAKEMLKDVRDTSKTYTELLGQYDEQTAKLNQLESQLQEINEARITEAQKIELSQMAIDKYNESLAAGEGYWESWLQSAKNSMENLDWLVQSTVENFTSSFGQAFESMITNYKSVGQAVGELFQNIGKTILRTIGEMIAQQLVYNTVQKTVARQAQASSAATQAVNAQATALQAGLAAFASTAAIPITGPALAPAAMATALAATQPIAAAIKGLALTGMAHDGINAVPKTGTWLLEKGERVMTAKTSASLDAVLSRLDRDSGSKGVQVNVINQTGTEMEARSTQRMDSGKLIIDLWLEGFSRNVSGVQDIVGGR